MTGDKEHVACFHFMLARGRGVKKGPVYTVVPIRVDHSVALSMFESGDSAQARRAHGFLLDLSCGICFVHLVPLKN